MAGNTSASVESLEPKAVWQFFAGMAAVPRPSKQEQRIRAHVRKVAESHGFKVKEDALGNMLIDVPATPGHEKAAVTVLQGHLDMVCEKNSGTTHDFDRDPIRLVLDRDENGAQIVRADGTTLGADNGIGVSLAFAAATSRDVVHGPLEILCTVDEEQGLSGAKVIAPDFFKGRRLLNLDSEEDDAIYIGCAGGCDTTLTWTLPTAAPPAGSELLRVSVSGLRGGHSGAEIHLNRANAIKLLVRTLTAPGDLSLRLAAMNGGSKRNAIPREAFALLAAPAGARAKLEAAARDVQAECVRYDGEEKCSIRVESAKPQDVAAVASAADTARALTGLIGLPHGVLAVVPEIAGLVQTSNGTTTVQSEPAGGKLRIIVGCLSRSSSRPQLEATARQIRAIAALAGAEATTDNGYPGWSPNVKSPTLAACRRVYEQVFGKEPRVTAIHAGLECGIIGERIGEGAMDMVSFGPNIKGAHSPDERVEVASVRRMYDYLVAVLAELAKA